MEQIQETDKVTVTNYNEMIDSFNELYAHIKVIYVEKLTPSHIVVVMSELIQFVEKYKTFTGQQKKSMVINVIKKMINEQTDKYTEQERVALMLVVNTTLPTMIDTTIDAINGLLKFTKDKTKNTCLRKFMCC